MAEHNTPIGYIVIDTDTNEIDWDGKLHPTRDAAIESMTGPGMMWCNSADEETEDKTYWGRAYIICPVGKPDTSRGGTA